MFDPPGLLQLAAARARYAAARQSVVAENVANADTPGYRSKDVESFAKFLGRMQSGASGPTGAPKIEIVRSIPFGESSPDGNTVSLETEMMHAGEAARDHDAAVSIYAKAMGFLRAALGKVG